MGELPRALLPHQCDYQSADGFCDRNLAVTSVSPEPATWCSSDPTRALWFPRTESGRTGWTGIGLRLLPTKK